MRISSAPSIERVTAPDEERDSTSSSTAASPERKETVSLSTVEKQDEKQEVEAAAAAVRKELAASRSAHLANIEAAVPTDPTGRTRA